MDNELVILVPAYNEEPRISSVLEVICSYNHNKRVVVIDDGSEDDTKEKAKKYPVELIVHEKNKGKGAALQTGIEYIQKSTYWLFLDADLINLSHCHMEALLNPLKENPETGMTVGMFSRGGKLRVDLAQKYFGILNGQRGLSQQYISILPNLSWARFGTEIFLSKYAAYKNIKVSFPVLEEITHYTKEEKLGFLTGFLYRLQMYRECLYSLFFWKRHIQN